MVYCGKGTLQMAILQPKVDNQENDLKYNEYETTKFTMDFDKLPPEDKIEWHKQIGNIVSRDMIQAFINVNRLNIQMINLEN
jgi:hypothetical protein